MCGAALGSAPYQAALQAGLQGRRTHSCLDLQECSDVLQRPGLCPSARAKSFTDLTHFTAALLDNQELAEGLSTLRFDEGSVSTHSGSDDTGRSSPTSSYDVLVHSRSPSAVVLAGEVASPRSAGTSACDAAAAEQQQQQPEAAAVPASQQPTTGVSAALIGKPAMLPADTPFLESAASFSVVEVVSTRVLPTAAAVQARSAEVLISAGSSQQSAAALPSLAADGTAAAGPPVFVSVRCTPACDTAAVVQSPFVALAGLPPLPPPTLVAQQPPSLLIPSPPSLLHQPPPPPPIALTQPASSLGTMPSLSLAGPSLSLGAASLGSAAGSSASSSPTARSASATGGLSESLARRRSLEGWGTSSHLSEGHAAEELFYRLNHARQTVDFVKRQATAFSALNKACMGVWEALELLNTLREYESALLGDADATPEMPLLEHALQCAEACRSAFPDEDYMHLAGLLAPLGKLLAHAKFGAEPQWAICGETYPVGCRFHPAVRHSQYFSANPDRRKRLYSSPTGVYREGCGLGGVLMSWGAGEYLHMVLRLNRVPLPPEALFCIRHQKLRCVFRPGCPYGDLLSEFDRVQMPRLAKFQQLCAYQRMPRSEPLLVPVPDGVQDADGAPALEVSPQLRQYYDGLLHKYIPQGVLHW